MTAADLSRRFLAFSSEVTAFTVYDLQGSGQADSYLSTVVRVVGEQTLAELLDAYERAQRTRTIEADILGSEKLGPIARNIIKLWYVGVWYGLPSEWTETFGARENDGTFTASADAYPEGLLWRAVGSNPPGARAPGYGSWAYAPVFPPIPGEEPDRAPAGVTTVDLPLQRGLQEQQAKESAQ